MFSLSACLRAKKLWLRSTLSSVLNWATDQFASWPSVRTTKDTRGRVCFVHFLISSQSVESLFHINDLSWSLTIKDWNIVGSPGSPQRQNSAIWHWIRDWNMDSPGCWALSHRSCPTGESQVHREARDLLRPTCTSHRSCWRATAPKMKPRGFHRDRNTKPVVPGSPASGSVLHTLEVTKEKVEEGKELLD